MLIDSTLTEVQLPDDVIGMSVFQGMAEKDVIRIYPAAATETDSEKIEHIQRATILLTASYIAPSIPSLQGEHLGNYQYRRIAIDSNALADRLRGLAEDELTQIDPLDDDGEVIPIMFTTAIGPRGM